MANNSKNIIVGAASIFASVNAGVVEELPAAAKTLSGPTAVTALEGAAGWRGLGYTSDGIEVSYEPDYGEVTVDQLLDSAKMFKQGMRVSVNTTLAEASLFNLMVAWGQDNLSLTGDEGVTNPTVAESRLDISGGKLHDDPIERSLAFVGKAPKGVVTGDANKKRERVYHLRRALQVESSAHSLSRADATTIPVSFRCLPVDNAPSSSGDYGVIIQRVVTS